MAKFSLPLTLRKAFKVRSILSGRNGLGSADRDSLSALLRRLERECLKTDDSGVHTAVTSEMIHARYSVQDLAMGISAEFLGQLIKGQNGKPVELRDYTESFGSELAPLNYDQYEKGALFRLCLDRLRDKKEGSGAGDLAVREFAGFFPGLQAAIQKTLRDADKPEPFKDELLEVDGDAGTAEDDE